jgi:carbamoyl-phosphate synthase large subunit
MNTINVIVTGAGGGGIGEQIIKCLRLSNLSCKIFACDITPVSKGKIDGDEFIILPMASDANYISTLLDICKTKMINVLVPGSEMELKVLSENREDFQALGIHLLINNKQLIETCLDKNLTAKFLNANGFLSPQSFSISSVEDLSNISVFPLVLKPSVGGGGSVNTMIVQNMEELKVFGQYLLNQYSTFIAQVYVGDSHSEFTVGVLSTIDGIVIDSIVLKRNILSGLGAKLKVLNQTGNSEFGKYLAISSGISQGEIVRNDTIQNVCESIANKLGSTGPLNIQCRLVDEKVYIFEINPRFSGTSPMRALAGFNELELSIKNRVSKLASFNRINYKLGQVVRGLNEFFV